MNAIHPRCIWSPDELHRHLFAAVLHAYNELCREPGFEGDWTEGSVVPGTKTMMRQAALLGKGGGDRSCGGFWHFGKKYIAAEFGTADISSQIGDRVCFERYGDFQFYTWGNWYDGQKRLLAVAEAESNPAELLGEFSNLLAWQCPFKCLFIAETPDLLRRLNGFCDNPENCARDCAGTTYLVAEIPDRPCSPEAWKRYRADIEHHGDQIVFRAID